MPGLGAVVGWLKDGNEVLAPKLASEFERTEAGRPRGETVGPLSKKRSDCLGVAPADGVVEIRGGACCLGGSSCGLTSAFCFLALGRACSRRSPQAGKFFRRACPQVVSAKGQVVIGGVGEYPFGERCGCARETVTPRRNPS